jgi:hypothetical protein
MIRIESETIKRLWRAWLTVKRSGESVNCKYLQRFPCSRQDTMLCMTCFLREREDEQKLNAARGAE